MLTVEEIKMATQGTEYGYYGIRIDEIQYSLGGIANNSHQLFQDPIFDEDDNLVYPAGEGIYSGFYDAGELDGTCVVRFDPDDEDSIARALDIVKCYYGQYVHVLAGNAASYGLDDGEIIIECPIVLAADKI